MNALINLEDAVVARGQRAWGKIKATAAEQRQLWREVGDALLIGKRGSKGAQGGFKAWREAQGFGDMDSRLVSETIWFAGNFHGVEKIGPLELTHPTHIRTWFNAQASAPTPDLHLDAPEPTVNLEAVAKQAR